MKTMKKYSIHYDFYFAKYWLVLVFAICVMADTAVVKILWIATDELTKVLCALTLIFASYVAVKFARLLLQSNMPVISIRDDRLIVERGTHLEIPFSEISAVKLADSGTQMFNRSLLIFLNNGLDNEELDVPLVSVPLLLIRGNGNHVVRLIRLYLNRKAQESRAAAFVLDDI
jgi:hypothetical protein